MLECRHEHTYTETRETITPVEGKDQEGRLVVKRMKTTVRIVHCNDCGQDISYESHSEEA